MKIEERAWSSSISKRDLTFVLYQKGPWEAMKVTLTRRLTVVRGVGTKSVAKDTASQNSRTQSPVVLVKSCRTLTGWQIFAAHSTYALWILPLTLSTFK